MNKRPLWYVPEQAFKHLFLDTSISRGKTAHIFADLCRLNILYMIMRAGSGHIGTSFSSIDIMSWLWLYELRNPNGDALDSDTFFSSKGHDAPALYAVLAGVGKLPFEKIHSLRRLGGLPGHPDIDTPCIPANTGSLGMGVSKAKGMILANRLRGKSGRVFVLTGDGELQEGQFWESLQGAALKHMHELSVIVDANAIQSDTWVSEVSDLGDLAAKAKAFGWDVFECSGHDLIEFQTALSSVCNGPRIIVARTLKGRGVSFMEQLGSDGLYKFHSGAPAYDLYTTAVTEVKLRLEKLGHLPDLETYWQEHPQMSLVEPQRLVRAYGEELAKIGGENDKVIVFDADLAVDCGLMPFKQKFPDRFIECGIAEQDMVSTAGSVARQGFLPVVHSFACFLTTRANEQIYNNATERTKIIYVGSLAGLLPGMPGHSHQSIRDVALMASVPNMTIIQPADEAETRAALRFAVEEAEQSVYIRLVSVPTFLPRSPLSQLSLSSPGEGMLLRKGEDEALIAYGPTLLSEAWKACDQAASLGVSVALYNFPWLNRLDPVWATEELGRYRRVTVIDDHLDNCGLGVLFQAKFDSRIIRILGVRGIPACGGNQEVLEHHGLDASSIRRQSFGAMSD